MVQEAVQDCTRRGSVSKHLAPVFHGTVGGQADAAEEAGKLIREVPRLWAPAALEERRRLLLAVLDAIYVDTRQTRSSVAGRPNPAFRPAFRVAASCEGPAIPILNEPLDGSSVFVVETGESRTPRPEEATQDILQA